MLSSPLILETTGIRKVFGELVALDNVALRLHRGSIHALLGENGAGKSTLVKCIMGYYQPDAGEILLNDHQVEVSNPRDAHEMGIGMVYQHFTLIPNMTVAENLVLARARLPAVINWKQEIADIESRLDNMPFSIPLNDPVGTLAAGEKQKVEIVKQLLLNARILILDEPTSVLTPNEADEILSYIKTLVTEQGLSVIIITHKFREVMGYADEVTVLRRGTRVGIREVAQCTTDELAAMMMGAEINAPPLQRDAQATGHEPILELENLEVQNDRGELAVRGASLSVRPGEIVGVAGVSGNGQRELVESLSGQRALEGGTIRIQSDPFMPDRQSMRKHRFYCLPEEPLRNACVPEMSVGENLALRVFDQPQFTRGRFFVNRARIRERARELIDTFKVRPGVPGLPIRALSGGNVQRAVLARELSDAVDVLVVANPCFGLDFNAVNEIHDRIMKARNVGAAVLLVSEDLDELIEMSDRIVVMAGGRFVYETTPADADRKVIGQHMAGH
jgi:ABC-type uncharacterized transport system ATPase subunit